MLLQRTWPNCEIAGESNSGQWIFGCLYFLSFFFFLNWKAVENIVLQFVPSCVKKTPNRLSPSADTSDSNKCIFPCIFFLFKTVSPKLWVKHNAQEKNCSAAPFKNSSLILDVFSSNCPRNTLLEAVSPGEFEWELRTHTTSANIQCSELKVVWNGGVSSQISKLPSPREAEAGCDSAAICVPQPGTKPQGERKPGVTLHQARVAAGDRKDLGHKAAADLSFHVSS